MEHAKRELVTTEQTTSDFEHWSSIESLPSQIRRAIRQAEFVIVPDEGFRDYAGPVFPVGTEDLFQFVRDRIGDPSTVEIAVEDVNYKEVALHFEVITLATILVKWVVAPVAVKLLADYLIKRLGSRFANAEVRASITVDQGDATTRKAVQISYEGPAQTFERTMGETISNLFRLEQPGRKVVIDHGDEPRRNS